MKAKVKKGSDLLFSEGYSNKWNDIKTKMIINFMDKTLTFLLNKLEIIC